MTTSTVPEEPATTTAAPSESLPDQAPTEFEAIDREDAVHLTIEMDGDPVQLEADRITVTYGGPSTSIFNLQNRASQDDLDGDSDEEAAPVVEASPATTTTAPVVRPPRPVAPAGDGVVYLTFDDGPHAEYTPQVLDILARHDAKATFFVVGRLAQAYPDIIERIAAEGHTLANHTWNHEDLATLTRPAFDETVGRTEAILGDLATPCLRPPYGSIGAHTREWAAGHGLSVLTWDGSPMDWLRPPATEIADYLVQWAPTGAVILLHDGGGNRSNTVQGLDMAMERLADRGLRYEPICR